MTFCARVFVRFLGAFLIYGFQSCGFLSSSDGIIFESLHIPPYKSVPLTPNHFVKLPF